MSGRVYSIGQVLDFLDARAIALLPADISVDSPGESKDYKENQSCVLIVEFANQLRDRGIALKQAIMDACARRLRPILMTAFTALAGTVPLLVIPALYRLISGPVKLLTDIFKSNGCA